MKCIFFILIFIALIILIILMHNNNYDIERYTESENDYVSKNDYVLPKIVYGYWDNLNSNKIIQSHINTWKRKISKDWTINILNKENVNEYVSKDFMERYKNLNPTRFSDFLRLELLKTGGTWIDAGIIITNGNFLDEYHNEMIKNKYDATLYELKQNTIDSRTPYLENWFIMAPKNSKLINDLYGEFDKSYSMGFNEYKKKILIPSNVKLDKTIGYDDGTYLMQHAIINYLMLIGNIYKINIKDAGESMFKIHDYNNWSHHDIIKFLIENKDWKNLYAIKLIKKTRSHIDPKNEGKYISNINSI